jgi:hypothetical protein
MGKFDEYLNKAKDFAEDAFKDVKAGKELKKGIAELEALPPYESSLLYNMEIEAISNYLNALALIIEDGRLDAESIEEEIRKVMAKVEPDAEVQPDDAEQQALNNARAIALGACERALAALNVSAGA